MIENIKYNLPKTNTLQYKETLLLEFFLKITHFLLYFFGALTCTGLQKLTNKKGVQKLLLPSVRAPFHRGKCNRQCTSPVPEVNMRYKKYEICLQREYILKIYIYLFNAFSSKLNKRNH